MNRELEERLRRSFPELYRDLYGDPKLICMGRGIECEDGWFDIINKLSLDIKSELEQRPDLGFHFTQIKNKFGRLAARISDRSNERIRELVDEVELRSITICELCGASDAEYHEPWYTSCAACYAAYERGSTPTAHPTATNNSTAGPVL